MDFETVRANLARVQEGVARIQAREGLVGRVTVIAVTKGHTADAVAAAVHAGATDVGENRVQEGLSKKVEVGDQPVKWHLIGHLQTNKAKYIPGTFGIVHSVDSGKLVRALDVAWGTRKTAGDDDKLRVLIQVNVAGEQQKGGCNPDALVALGSQRGFGLPNCRWVCRVITKRRWPRVQPWSDWGPCCLENVDHDRR